MRALLTFHVYADERGEWRWVARARNGRKVASSGEAFHGKAGAARAANRFLSLVLGAQDRPARSKGPAVKVQAGDVRQMVLDV